MEVPDAGDIQSVVRQPGMLHFFMPPWSGISVEVNGLSGKIESIGLPVISPHTDRRTMVMPNSDFAQKTVIKKGKEIQTNEGPS